MRNSEPHRYGRFPFRRGSAGDEQRPESSLEIGQQDRIAKRPNGLLVAAGLLLEEIRRAGRAMHERVFFEVEFRQRVQHSSRELWIRALVAEVDHVRPFHQLHVELFAQLAHGSGDLLGLGLRSLTRRVGAQGRNQFGPHVVALGPIEVAIPHDLFEHVPALE